MTWKTLSRKLMGTLDAEGVPQNTTEKKRQVRMK
jgi:hypothetical protein